MRHAGRVRPRRGPSLPGPPDPARHSPRWRPPRPGKTAPTPPAQA
ncbi:hypothetical protein BER1_3560 [plant metagenome]|uniref:Uncharacterized protein n=1 Tax=plant metagenome TaxID=1297885 RepID=A0A484RDE5_9ZZZZ